MTTPVLALGDCDSARSADPRIARVAARPPTVV